MNKNILWLAVFSILSISPAAVVAMQSTNTVERTNTPLMDAVLNGSDAVRALLDQGADVNSADKYGNSALIASTRLSDNRVRNFGGETRCCLQLVGHMHSDSIPDTTRCITSFSTKASSIILLTLVLNACIHGLFGSGPRLPDGHKLNCLL